MILSTFLQLATLVTLSTAIVGLWLKPSVWQIAMLLSVVFGYASHLLYGAAVLPILLLSVLCWSFSIANGFWKALSAVGILLISFALGVHGFPGFNNYVVAKSIVLVPDAAPFDLYLNYDKTIPGILILAFCYQGLLSHTRDLTNALRTALPVTMLCIGTVIAASYALGYLRFEPHWPTIFWSWCYSNLFLTCVSEEAFFRGFIQNQLSQLLVKHGWGSNVSLFVTAMLFGIAHFAGGLSYVLLASLAGLFYGYIFQRTKRIEMSILMHFSLNLTHFLLFTYPRLATH